MSSITGAGNPRGAGSRYSQLPQPAAARPTDSQRGTEQGLSTRGKIGIGCLALLVLGANETLFSFKRCVDTNNPLSAITNPQDFEYLKENGYVVQEITGEFIPTDKLVQAMNGERTDETLAEFLEKQGIDTQERFTSEHCRYTLLEVLANILTGHADRYCPPYRPSETKNTTCVLSEQEAGAEKQNATEFFA